MVIEVPNVYQPYGLLQENFFQNAHLTNFSESTLRVLLVRAGYSVLRTLDQSALFAVASDPLIWEIHPATDRWQEPVFRAFFDDALAQGGALAIIDRASGTIIGSSRFQGHDPAGGGSVEIGWTFLARSHWGGAYNPELKRLRLSSLDATAKYLVQDHALFLVVWARYAGQMLVVGERP